MHYSMKWMDLSELSKVQQLSADSYANPKDTYPVALKPDSRMFELFMIPEDVKGHEWRKTLGVYDANGELLMVAGIRRMQHQPVWLLSYVLSSQKNIGMVRAFREMIMFLCDHHERIGINEFAVASPSSREEGYRKIMRFLRERYVTWVECTIPANTRSPWPVYHSMVGYAVHEYDINLRRYVKRRDKMDPDE